MMREQKSPMVIQIRNAHGKGIRADGIRQVKLIAAGTPEQTAQNTERITGRYL